MKKIILPGLIALLCALSCSKGRDAVPEPRSEADLSGLTLSTSAGNYYYTKYSGREDITLFPVNSDADGVESLRQGIADVFVTDGVAIPEDMRQRLNIKLAFYGDEEFEVAYALRKGNDALREELNRFIAESKADGSLDAVISHWVEGTPAPADPVPGRPSGEGPLRCITSLNMEPVCFIGEGGQWMGMDADILRRFAIWSGRDWKMWFQDLGSGIISVQTGQGDILSACLYVTEERKKSVDFSDPYYMCRPGYFVLDRGAESHRSFSDRVKANLVTEKRWKLITDGLWETVKLTFLSILLGTLLGIGVCAAQRSRKKWVRKTIGVYGGFIQGTPTLVLLLIMFYIVFAKASVSGTFVAVITFSLFFAWSSGSVFNNAISSVPRGQAEAGLSLGFTPLKTFTGIVFPQALKSGLAPYTAECITLLKGTSIVGYIAIQDLTRASDFIRSRTFDALIPLLVVTILYFVLAWIIRLLLKLLLLKK